MDICDLQFDQEKDSNSFNCKMRSLINRNVDESAPFFQQVDDAIRILNENIRYTQLYIENLSQSSDTIHVLKSICDDMVESEVTLAVVGRVNSGKSMLTSALLDWEIILPSSDEATTGRLTRFVYSKTPVIRKVETYEWTDNGILHQFRESVLMENPLKESISDYTQLSESHRYNLESLSTIIEIGLPSQLLKTGLKIIDCPGLDENELLSQVELQILVRIKPLIICYVYDQRLGFSMADGMRIKEIIEQLRNYDKDPRNAFIIVANKCDTFDENLMDSTLVSFPFEEHQANTTFRQNTPWKHLLTFPFLDKDKLLPVLSLSTAKLFLFSHSGSNSEDNLKHCKMFNALQNKIVSKIMGQSRSILSYLALRLSGSEMDLFYSLKSLSVEDDLIELITTNSFDEQNLLLDFNVGFKIYGLSYRGDPIHITTLSKNLQIDFEQEKRRILLHETNMNYDSLIVYENHDRSCIYLVEKERPHTRLLDQLNDYSFNKMIRCLKNISQYIDHFFTNFRPDNVYIDEANDAISLNTSVPNYSKIPLLLKGERTVYPFHLHPDLKNLYPFIDDPRLGRIQNIYSFAWMMWILIDGRGTECVDVSDHDVNHWIELLQKGKFSHHSEDLNKIMVHCFKIDLEEYGYKWHHEFKEHLSKIFQMY